MANTSCREELIKKLENQLVTARNEIKNLRKQVFNLKINHEKEVKEIQSVLKGIKCYNCKNEPQVTKCNCEFGNFKSIGIIKTWFPKKRGIPRQGVLCSDSQGILKFHSKVVNNPKYALSGLEEFSHLWIIYHFHSTDGNHVRTKIAPPKLNGAKVGVFGTRSPHRPCPIGLSVVKIEKITENEIYFSGVDMLDGTPVLDIKPYIPQYDNPTFELSKDKEVEQEEQLPECRTRPDGEENCVTIPHWIANSVNAKLKIEFSKKALEELECLDMTNELKNTIINIVEEDPRSVYLKRRVGNQLYTFLIKSVNVVCKFDDANGIVVVESIIKAG